MNLIVSTANVLELLDSFLKQIQHKTYKKKLAILSNASLGEHVRHIIEFYQCLLMQYESGNINYDLRERNHAIQDNPKEASKAIYYIVEHLSALPLDKTMQIATCYNANAEEVDLIQSNLKRELAYNLEHTIHHMAILKIGIRHVAAEINLPQNFGVAASTIKFNRDKVCVQ